MDYFTEDNRIESLLFAEKSPILLPLKKELRKKRMIVFESQTTEEVLDLVQWFRFDFFLIDLLLPGHLSGYDLCKRLKEDVQTKSIPVFLFCNHPLPVQVTQSYFLELKAQWLILPPFDPVHLCQQICLTLRSRPGQTG